MRIRSLTGAFAGDKDAAARIREEHITPALEAGRKVVLDFQGVDLATQSFIHALIASTVRESPAAVDRMEFRNCNSSIRSLVEIVIEYAQDEFG